MALLALGWRLGDSPLAGTEPHRVIPAQAMVTTGEWLVPELYGAPYLRKPPLHYWLIAMSISVGGLHSEAVHRLPSLLAAALTCVAVSLAAWRWFGVRRLGQRAPHRSWLPDPVALAGGLACLSLICLWGQWRSADVDASNAFFGATAGLAVLEIGRRRGRRAGWMTALAALLLGGGLLVKGPACLPVVLGAVVGAIWLARGARLRVARCSAVAALGGLAIFAVWGVTAWLGTAGPSGGVGGGGSAIDWSGLEEALERAAGRPGALTRRLLMPLILLALGLPVTALLGMPWRHELQSALGTRRARLGRAVVLSWLAALALGMLGGVDNPRYAYLTLVPLATLAGAVAAVALAGGFSESVQRNLRALLTLLSAVMAGLAIAFWLAASDGAPGVGTWTLLGLTALLGLWTITQWVAQRPPRGLVGMTVLLVLLGAAFGEHRNDRRRALSAAAASPHLRELVGAGRVVSGMWVMNAPELFLYAKLDVEYHPHHLNDSTPFAEGDWVVFQQPEWESLPPARRGAFEPVVPLPVRERDALAARYVGQPQE